MTIFGGVGASQAIGPTSGGKVTPVNTVSNAAFAQVVAGNPQRVSLTFANPGANTIYVAPMVTATGATLTPSLAALGGTFPIFSGGLLTIGGECQQAWGAIAAAGVNNPLTVMESNT